MRSTTKFIKDVGTFLLVELKDHAGLARRCSNRTIRRFLNINDYGFYHCRKKGQLTLEDLEKRPKFCQKCKQLSNHFWESGIQFYFLGNEFAQKTNQCKIAQATCIPMQ